MRRGPVPGRRSLAAILVAGLCLFAGCSGLLDDGDRPTYDVPRTSTTEDAQRTVAVERFRDPPASNGSAVVGSEPRYFDLRPTCERPPSLVVAIQVGALRNDGPEDRGLRTTYEFATPGYRWALGPFPRFVQLLESNYRPLLDAERVTYGPVERSNGTASVPVTVLTPDGEETNYRWRLVRQTAGAYDGCWMTNVVRDTSRESPPGPSPNGSIRAGPPPTWFPSSSTGTPAPDARPDG